jgi:hypothetical protein
MCPLVSFLLPRHLECLRAVSEQRATVGAHGFAIDGVRLTGDRHMAMSAMWLDELVWGPADAVEPELLWLTEAGEQALAAEQNKETK